MATRRSKKGTPKKASGSAAKSKRAASSSKKITTQEGWIQLAQKQRLAKIQKQKNVSSSRLGRYTKTTKRITGPRDETFNATKDFLSASKPIGRTWLTVKGVDERPYFTTARSSWLQTYQDVDAKAGWYIENRRDIGYDERITVEVTILTERKKARRV